MTYWSDPTYRELLRAVIAAPRDDSPRYQIADWLLEHGDPAAADRAAFIIRSLRHERHTEVGIRTIAPEVRWPGEFTLRIDDRVYATGIPAYGVVTVRHGFIDRIGTTIHHLFPILRRLGRTQPLLDLNVLSSHVGGDEVEARRVMAGSRYWFRDRRLRYIHSVPPGVWRLLEPDEFSGSRAVYHCGDTWDHPYQDLVRACLQYAKS